MPTDPTARDVETARALSPCWYATPDDPGATCNGVGAPDCCAECQIAERIARALATARAEEREACATAALRMARHRLPCGCDPCRQASDCAAAIRARGEGA